MINCKLGFVVLVAIALQACSVAKLPYVKGVEDVDVNKVTLDSINVGAVLKINNPGAWGFRIKKADFDVLLNGKSIAHLDSKMPFRITRKEERPYRVNISASTANAIGAIPDFMTMLGGRSMDLRLQGYIKVRWFIFSKKIRFDKNTPIKMPKIKLGLGRGM